MARNIDFEVANVQVLMRTRRKTSMLKLQSVKIGGGLARNAGFPVASPCLWGKLQNISFSKVSKQVVMSFCVAGAALCDIPTCLIMCRKLFCVAGAILLRVLHKIPVAVVVARAAFWRSLSSFCMAGAALQTCRVACCTLHTLHSHPLHFTLPHFTLYTLHSLYTPHFALYTLHSTLYTLHFTLYT